MFDNYRAPREAVENYLRTKEVDEVLQTFPVTMKAGLDFLYSRMGWVFSHPCSALWWVFFDDLWEQNKDMKIMNNRRNMFDSRSSDSLAYVATAAPPWRCKAWAHPFAFAAAGITR